MIRMRESNNNFVSEIESISSYKDFNKVLDDILYKTTSKIRSSITTNSVHINNMFKSLDKKTAQLLINKMIEYEELHPDNIKYIQKNIIDAKEGM